MADYEKIKRLGSGNFGEVWLVYDQALDVKRAVKYIHPSRITDPTSFYKEPRTLMALQHDNIVKIEDAGKTPEGILYVAMEYLPKGSVENVFKGAPVVPLRTALNILKDVSWAVEYAHQNNYIHHDIKPANILLTKDGKAKLSDFGLATQVPRGKTASICGYLSHIAPEVFQTGRTSKISDIYALGVTAYRLINGDGFLPEVSDDSIQDLILLGKYPNRNKYRPYVPSQVKRIVNQCMAIDEAKRYRSTADFRRALENLSLCCDWYLKRRKHNVISYRTKINSAKISVVISPKNNKFDIETIREVTKGQPRRVTKDCLSNLTLTQMKKTIRQILSRYVTKGK